MLTLWLKERWLSSDTQCSSETCELLKRSKRVQRAHLNAFALPVHVQWTRSLCMATAFTARSFSYCFFMDSFLFLSSKTNKTKQEYITGGKHKEGMVFGVVRCSHHGLQWYLRCCFNTDFFCTEFLAKVSDCRIKELFQNSWNMALMFSSTMSSILSLTHV